MRAQFILLPYFVVSRSCFPRPWPALQVTSRWGVTDTSFLTSAMVNVVALPRHLTLWKWSICSIWRLAGIPSIPDVSLKIIVDRNTLPT